MTFYGHKENNSNKRTLLDDMPFEHRIEENFYYSSDLNWGYTGEGPRSLAYAILYFVFDKEIAVMFRQQLVKDVISKLPDEWYMESSEVIAWYEELHIVKRTCIHLGIKQKELADDIGVSETTMTNWAKNKVDIPKWALLLFELLIEKEKRKLLNEKLDEIIEIANSLKLN